MPQFNIDCRGIATQNNEIKKFHKMTIVIGASRSNQTRMLNISFPSNDAMKEFKIKLYAVDTDSTVQYKLTLPRGCYWP